MRTREYASRLYSSVPSIWTFLTRPKHKAFSPDPLALELPTTPAAPAPSASVSSFYEYRSSNSPRIASTRARISSRAVSPSRNFSPSSANCRLTSPTTM